MSRRHRGLCLFFQSTSSKPQRVVRSVEGRPRGVQCRKEDEHRIGEEDCGKDLYFKTVTTKWLWLA